MKHNFDVFGKKTVTDEETRFKVSMKKDDFFIKLMSMTDFTKCKNDLEAVRTFWHSVWPVMEQIMADNEILLNEQSKTLRKYAEIVEQFKLLEVEHEKLKEEYKNATGEEFQSESEEGA